MNSHALTIKNLSYQYANNRVLDDISFFVNSGEIFGIVGPDGSGKTTIIKNCCGLLTPKDGKCLIFDLDTTKDKNEIKNKIGYLSQKFSLYSDLTVDENINFFAEIHNVKNYKERKRELLQFTRMEQFNKRVAKKLSGGMKQKLALACTLIHKPDIIFLDEPTTGVDPVSRRDFWKILNDLSKTGLTIVMSTPYLDEVERASRIAMLNKGRIIACDSSKNIKSSLNNIFYEIYCSPVRRVASMLNSMDGVNSIQTFSDKIHIGFSATDTNIEKIISLLTNSNIQISSSNKIIPSLEDAFINLVARNE